MQKCKLKVCSILKGYYEIVNQYLSTFNIKFTFLKCINSISPTKSNKYQNAEYEN